MTESIYVVIKMVKDFISMKPRTKTFNTASGYLFFNCFPYKGKSIKAKEMYSILIKYF